MVAYGAVVRDVGVGEEIAMASDDGLAAGGGAAVYGDEFAEGIAIADFEIGGLGFVFQVLALLANRGEGEEFIVGTDGGGAGDDDVILQPATVSEGDALVEDAIGANFDASAELHAGVNDGGGVDIGLGHRGEMASAKQPPCQTKEPHSWKAVRLLGNKEA